MSGTDDTVVNVRHLVDDVPAEIARLRAARVAFRNDIVTGAGCRQFLLEDPSGNSIEPIVPAVSP
jgi:hypothetical protein